MVEREAELLFSFLASAGGLPLPKCAETSAHLFGGKIGDSCQFYFDCVSVFGWQ
jgi:hypothetical protein